MLPGGSRRPCSTRSTNASSEPAAVRGGVCVRRACEVRGDGVSLRSVQPNARNTARKYKLRRVFQCSHDNAALVLLLFVLRMCVLCEC